MLKQKLSSTWMLMLGRVWQMAYQKDDTISLGVCKVFLIRLSAPQPEAGSYFSPYVP